MPDKSFAHPPQKNLFFIFKIITWLSRADFFTTRTQDIREVTLKKSDFSLIIMALWNFLTKIGGGRYFWQVWKVDLSAILNQQHEFLKILDNFFMVYFGLK